MVSTVMPRTNVNLKDFLCRWIELKNRFNGEAGLQISINTTVEIIRNEIMPFASRLSRIHWALSPSAYPVRETPPKPLLDGLKGRKITLNFALTDAPVDAYELRRYFDPKYFMCKITPMHNTRSAVENGMITDGGYDCYYPYKQVEEDLKAQGFDVIVFIPSKEEDESRITCGNAILAGEDALK